MAGKTAKSFAQRVLANVNKDEATLKKELVEEKVADFIIECNTQITLIETSSIPRADVSLTKAKNNLKKAKAALKNSSLEILDFSFEGLVDMINSRKENVESIESEISSIEGDIATENEMLEGYKTLLAELQS